MISDKEIKKLAQLARLQLTEKELEKMKKELEQILNYVKKLKEIDEKSLPNFEETSILKNVFREDKPREYKLFDKKVLITLAPEKEDNYFKVKQVIQKQ